MNRVFFLLLVGFAYITVPALAQRGPVGVGLEVHGAYLSMTDGSFQDPKPDTDRLIAHGWLNDVSRGVAVEGRVSIRLPWGIRPYVGYHRGQPRESAPNHELWRQIYGGVPDFENGFTEHDSDVDIRTEGWSAGLMYEPHWLYWPVKPYLIGEIRTESFRSETRLKGFAEVAEGLCCLISGPFEGESILEAETVYGYGVGLGVHVPVKDLGVTFPFGHLSIVPEIKYVSVPNAQINRREFRWVVLPVAEEIVRSEFEGFLDILDGQTIDHRYVAFRLGLRYEPL